MDGNINKYLILVALIAGLGGFLFGFDSSVIADIQDQVIHQLSLTQWQWSQVVSASLLGSVFGIPLSGFIADHLSRKTLLKLVALGFILGTSFCALASNLDALLLGRFLIGICIGIASYIAPLFIAEIAPAEKRGSLILVNGLALTFGQAAAYLTGYLLHDNTASSWRLILWTGAVPATLLFAGMFFVPHSPRWLMKKHGLEKTLHALRRMRPLHADLSQELDEITLVSQTRHSLKFLCSKPVLAVLSVGIVLGLFQQLSGINAIMYYGPMIFQKAGFVPVKNAILATFCIGLTNFIFTAVTLFTVDYFGRRFLLLHGSLLAALSLFAVGLIFHFTIKGQALWVLFFLALYTIGYCISVGSLFWVIISEIFPQAIRGLGMSIATVFQWAANFLVSISFLKIYSSAGEFLSFSLFGTLCMAAFFFIYYFIPETTGISLEKIEANLLTTKRVRELGQNISKPLGLGKKSRVKKTENAPSHLYEARQ